MYNYTPEELLLYLYKETSTEQTIAIEEELKKYLFKTNGGMRRISFMDGNRVF